MKSKKYLTPLKKIFLSLFFMGVVIIFSLYFLLRGSLPTLSGSYLLPKLKDTVRVERDGRGIPSLYASSRLDIAQALGYVHAQDRFFQMDLMRRASAGELSELFGPVTIDFDKSRRFHQFRNRARYIVEQLNQEEITFLQAYTEGVNNGIQSLAVRPFEYLLLYSKPKEWKIEDTLLVCYGLFFELQDSEGVITKSRGYMKKLLPETVYNFFMYNSSAWESALDYSQRPLLPIPSAESFQYLQKAKSSEMAINSETIQKKAEFHVGGSNQWAARQSPIKEKGKALLACDMHLHLSVPTLWYRAGFNYSDKNGEKVAIYGATLPGTPFMIIGSNKHIAWGFTNACLNTTDGILIHPDPANTDHYLTSSGSRKIETELELIHVKGQDPVPFSIRKTIWGPISEDEFLGQPMAISWVAHHSDCMNLNIIELESVKNVEQALNTSKKIKMPILNFMVVDKDAHIGWTLIGGIPNRIGYEGTTPVSFLDENKKVNGFIDPINYPIIMDPPQNILWTANNRTLGNEWVSLIGQTGFVNGIRAYQIQKNLKNIENMSPKGMLDLQLNNEAIFFLRWQTLLLEVLAQADKTELRKKLIELIGSWNTHCESDSVAYNLIRGFRKVTLHNIITRLMAPCFATYPKLPYTLFDFEEPVWLIVNQQPAYLLNPVFHSWNDELLSYLDELVKDMTLTRISQETWGKNSHLKMKHPLHESLPFFKEWLRMPYTPISGDYYVIRVHSPSEGASQRMVVEPGKEEEGIFEMPGGQSGHPLSPHYRDSHNEWVEGYPTPFLPGKTLHTLIFNPKLN